MVPPETAQSCCLGVQPARAAATESLWEIALQTIHYNEFCSALSVPGQFTIRCCKAIFSSGTLHYYHDCLKIGGHRTVQTGKIT